MRAGSLIFASALAVWWTTACTGADADPGLDLELRITGAQLVRGPLPRARAVAESAGPAVTFVDVHLPEVVAGEGNKLMEGRAAAGAFAIAVGLEGDAGYWRVPVGLEDPAVAGELAFAMRADFARTLAPGDRTLALFAVDGDERVGPRRDVTLRVLSPIPDGELVVSLFWDRDADVDLYVTDPNGVTIDPKNINTYVPPAPGEPPDPPDAFEQGGFIDADANANCVSDGRRHENAVWRQPPPPGRYRVAVDLASACETERTSFGVEVRLSGDVIATAAGALYPIDARDTAAGGAPPLFVVDVEVP